MKTYDLIIIGAGPAGMCAAIQASSLGITPLVIDENDHPGGRIYTQSTLIPADSNLGTEKKKNLLKQFSDCSKVFYTRTQVIGVFPDNLLLVTGKDGISKLKYKSLVIACGARELSIPFPGWTLPGVMTSGCVQTLLKTQGLFPEKIVVAGTGPLQLILADQIIKKGGQVLALVDTGSFKSWLKAGLALLNDWQLAKQMASCLLTLIKHRVPIFFQSLVSSAQGIDSLKTIVISTIKGKFQKKILTPALCVGYGFVPSNGLSLAAGAKQEFKHGQWGPVRDRNMRTTMDGIFAAGDGARINGAAVAGYEGSLASISASLYLKKVSVSKADKKRNFLFKKIKNEERLRKQFTRIMEFPDRLYDLACDDTTICRCEEINLKQFKEAVKKSGPDINEIKRLSRVGMGICQGRTCCSSAIKIASKLTGISPEKLGTLSPRPPFKPVTLGQLANKQ